ncbi:MAG: CRISPR-associated endonuclease Cas1, partial [Paracoccaceae bacterium]|nr:CRISPR-associated endonuclease Cas1 [Paracoccaceae bacterium]
MKKLLNTVYVTTEGAALHKDGEALVAEVEGAEKTRVPLHMLASVVVFGPVLVTPALIGACAERGISMALMGRNGRFQARIEGPVSGNVLLRREQYRRADTAEDIVRSIVLGKVANQRAVIRRALRDYGDEMDTSARASLEAATDRMAQILRR